MVATYQWPETADIFERAPYIVRFRARNYGRYTYSLYFIEANSAVMDCKMLCHDDGIDPRRRLSAVLISRPILHILMMGHSSKIIRQLI